MAVNSWVYLPEEKQWINFDHVVRVVERWNGEKQIELASTRIYYDTDYDPPRMLTEQHTIELYDKDAIIVEEALRGRQ